ncbi:hypothetical protein PENSUB_2521 [Penicillium subrubescens]|uniref:Uncharacterized protein n=2 Tax=Penicillium subrubescens TaxID=1316194 RepID=A0A1Q5UHQ7_9EURO|nr:hypothetical protein PENSUB_2521 [Penicillium subrubescens]
MTEIGHAQRRLLDDDPYSTGQHLPSTITPYPSEISQPGSFPSIPNYPYQQVDEVANDNYTYTRPVVEDSYEVTQLVAPAHANGYEYSTPATSNNVESPSDPNDRAATFSTSVQLNDGVYANHPPKTVQRSRSMQSQPWSPHDTEPLSSVVSPGLSRSKSDNARSGLMSPQHSEGSAHDELALPMVAPTTAADASTVLKKRGQPKKQSLPEDDEEDELAAPRNYFNYEFSKAGHKTRREPSPKKQAVEMDVIEINDDVDEPPTNEARPHHVPGLMVVLPVAFDGKSKRNDASGSKEAEKATTKAPKKKVKRSKTASAVLDKSNRADVDDDVTWLDSNPLEVAETKTTEKTDEPQRAQDAPVEEVPGPKKRGRKRKKTAEAAPVVDKQQQPPETENAASHNAPPTEEYTDPIPEPLDETTDPTKETPQPSKQQESTPTPDLPPQTPHRPEGKENDPATAEGSHKGPTKHSPILSTTKVPYRVGLSKRARIAPLLKIVRK